LPKKQVASAAVKESEPGCDYSKPRVLDEAVPTRQPADDAALPQPQIADHSLYFNREISWLGFNQRVLNEAAARGWPLLERLKFFAIFFSNLDEFFMIRVSALHEQVAAQVSDKSPDGLGAREQLIKIGATVRSQLEQAAALLKADLLPSLEASGIRLRRWDELDEARREQARRYFRDTVFPVLTPLVVDPVHPFPFLSNLSLSLAVEVRDPRSQVARFARVKVPEILPRFVRLEEPGERADADTVDAGARVSFLPSEELIRANLQALFPGMEI
jgi:polyphosphate kinase